MTTSSYGDPLGADPTEPGSGQTAGAADQARDVAGTAKDEGAHVASVAKHEAKRVTGEAKQQASNLIGDARSQVEDQTRLQRDRLVGTLRTFADDLEKMVAGQGTGQGMAADLTRQVAGRARDLTDAIRDREPGEMVDQVRGFARRRPGTFLLGALALGVVAGRLGRGAKDAQSSGQAEPSPYDQIAAETPPPGLTGPLPPDVTGTAPVPPPGPPTTPPTTPPPGALPGAGPVPPGGSGLPPAGGPYTGGVQ